jgi:hypothetical protein
VRLDKVKRKAGKIGGARRAEILAPERRAEIARQAAQSRWGVKPARATHGSEDHPLIIGDIAIPCFVLENDIRVLTQGGFTGALGMARGGSMVAGMNRLQLFVSRKGIKSFIPKDLVERIANPIPFITPTGVRAHGFEATLLADVCEAVLKAREAGALQAQQLGIAAKCEILVRGFARVGIIALVDEVTGYQNYRARNALAEILEQFIAKELRPYIRTFPSEFYENLFRLRGLEFPRDTGKKPQYFGHLTNDIVYARLAPGILEELRNVVPKRESGKGHKYPFTRRLTDDVGHPKLREHLASVTTIMKLSDEYPDFEVKLDRIHPRYDESLSLALLNEDGEPV